VTSAARGLLTVRIIHSVVWLFFVGCIVAIPIAGWLRRFDVAAMAGGLVLVEVVILALNRWSCPLTAVAARYTEDRRANFDIFLPLWLAQHNKEVFGGLFVAGALFTLALWLGWIG
jgi:hypothetical protein